MDKKPLKNELKKFAVAFEEEGRALDFVGITPIFPELNIASYALQIQAQWLALLPSYDEGLRIVIEKLYACLTPDFRKFISRVEICYKEEDIRCVRDDVVVNNTDYNIPYVIPYVFSE